MLSFLAIIHFYINRKKKYKMKVKFKKYNFLGNYSLQCLKLIILLQIPKKEFKI